MGCCTSKSAYAVEEPGAYEARRAKMLEAADARYVHKPQNPARLFLRFRHLRFELFNTSREEFLTIPTRRTHAIRPNASSRLFAHCPDYCTL
ncbi:hypothetical protein N9L76_08850 [bacterium]|nr:hypothetical protein [bacterium]